MRPASASLTGDGSSRRPGAAELHGGNEAASAAAAGHERPVRSADTGHLLWPGTDGNHSCGEGLRRRPLEPRRFWSGRRVERRLEPCARKSCSKSRRCRVESAPRGEPERHRRHGVASVGSFRQPEPEEAEVSAHRRHLSSRRRGAPQARRGRARRRASSPMTRSSPGSRRSSSRRSRSRTSTRT